MEMRYKHCREFFCPCEDTLHLIAEGFISSDSVNTCDSRWDMFTHSEYDYSDSFSDADPGL